MEYYFYVHCTAKDIDDAIARNLVVKVYDDLLELTEYIDEINPKLKANFKVLEGMNADLVAYLIAKCSREDEYSWQSMDKFSVLEAIEDGVRDVIEDRMQTETGRVNAWIPDRVYETALSKLVKKAVDKSISNFLGN